MNARSDRNGTSTISFITLMFGLLTLPICIILFNNDTTALRQLSTWSDVGLFTVGRTNIGANLLVVAIIIVTGIVSYRFSLFDALRSDRRRGAAFFGLMALTFIFDSLSRSVSGGQMTIPMQDQFVGSALVFFGFWASYLGVSRRTLLQAFSLFFLFSLMYLLLDVVALPGVVTADAPATTIAGAGLVDSVFLYPAVTAFSYAVGQGLESLIAASGGKRTALGAAAAIGFTVLVVLLVMSGILAIDLASLLVTAVSMSASIVLGLLSLKGSVSKS